MQQKSGKLISPAEYARRRGLNRSTVSRQIADGKIPTIDGLVDPKAADVAREQNLDQVRKQQAADRKAKSRKETQTPKPKEPTPQLTEEAYAERLGVVRQIASIKEQLAFAKAAISAGCSREQACALALRYAAQVSLAVEIDDSDLESLENFPSPSAAQWKRALGDFDMQAAEELDTRFL